MTLLIAIAPKLAFVLRAMRSIGAAHVFPADQRVAEDLAEDAHGIHAQPEDLHEATATVSRGAATMRVRLEPRSG